MQVEITQPIPLLDGAGNLTQAGDGAGVLPGLRRGVFTHRPDVL